MVQGDESRLATHALAAKRHAQVTRILNISDMVLSVEGRPIVHCLQPQTVHVAYHRNVRLRIAQWTCATSEARPTAAPARPLRRRASWRRGRPEWGAGGA